MINISRGRLIVFKVAAAILMAVVLVLIVLKTYQAPSENLRHENSVGGEKTNLQPTPTSTRNGDNQERTLNPGIPTGLSATQPSSTYRPGQVRAYRQFTGTVDKNGDIDRRVPGWWLYAKSIADASWLDNYGFPTPIEEARLNASTDAELSALVAMGDLNAKAHQATRFAKKIVSEGNLGQANVAAGLLSRSMSEGGGPYQAFAVSYAYAEMLQTYQSLPENQRTADQRTILTKLGIISQIAYAYGTMFGDETISAMSHVTTLTDDATGGITREMSGAQIAETMAAFARRRSEQGLPPITIIARPSARQMNSQNSGATVFERY